MDPPYHDKCGIRFWSPLIGWCMGISRICRFSPQLSFLSNLRSVWIELILLKLKIENWKYCSKIIFKYVIVPWDPFLMKKLLKSDICGFVNSARMHYSRLKSQHTVAANLLKCMPKKQKKRFENANVGLEMQIQTHTKERFGSTVTSHVRISKPTFAFSDFFFFPTREL